MWDDEELTQEEQNAEYLQENPQIESALWSEWVQVVCGWDKIPNPTQEEWARLRTNFYHGKAPIESVAELKRMREECRKREASLNNCINLTENKDAII